ncbi:MAG: 8-oxo-dGTP diphosphatase, partial [Acidimicrobiaceae bacterium]
IGWVERLGENHHFVILDFAVTLLDPEADPVAGDDAQEAAWVPLHEVADFQLVEGLAEFLHDNAIIETIL